MPSFYQQHIREELARIGLVGKYDPAAIEAWMRLEHSTLDGLTKLRFSREVFTACALIDAASSEQTAELVESFGLAVTP